MYYAPGMQTALRALYHVILPVTLCPVCFSYTHYTDEETEL